MYWVVYYVDLYIVDVSFNQIVFIEWNECVMINKAN